MPWPAGRSPSWDVGRLDDSVPCPAGHVGEFTRAPRRKCKACQRERMRAKRAALRVTRAA